jgi:hypothetical protein
LLDENENVIMNFDPINLSIACEMDIINELGFVVTDLEYAAMYYYDDESFTWIELAGDLNSASDTVESKVSKSGTYAVGVYFDDSMDAVPVKIDAHYPENLETIQPNDTIWAHLIENPIGSGIDFTKTQIIVDGEIVESMWNPVSNMLYYVPKEPITDGEHSFVVNAYDNNGNFSSEFSVFKVASTYIDYSFVLNHLFRFECYPNPGIENVTISIYNPGANEDVQVTLFDSKGELISVLFDGMILNGINEIQFSRNSIEETNIEPGIYFVQYRNATNAIVRKLIFK